LISYLSRTARSFLLTTSLPASCIAAALASIKIITDDHELRDRLWQNTNYYKKNLKQFGFNLMESKTPIVPILIGSDNVAQKFCDQAYDKGLYATKIGNPYVAEGTARVRTIISAAHKQKDIDKAISVFELVGKKLKII
jgi:glycine C-acetyltransferase